MILAYHKALENGQPPAREAEQHRADLLQYAAASGLVINEWQIGRRLKAVLARMKPGDVLLTTEISNLGDSLRDIRTLVNSCISRRLKIIVTRDNYVFDDSLSTQLLLTALETAIKIASDIKSQNTRKTLQWVRSQGKKLGRPRGSSNRELKLSGSEDKIRQYLRQKISKSEIARRLGVNRMTLYAFLNKLNK